MSNEKALQEFKKVLLAEPVTHRKVASDPLAVAWANTGTIIRNGQGTPGTWNIFRGGSSKLILVAVACLNAEGRPATPKAVANLMNGTIAVGTLSRSLRKLTGQFKMYGSWTIDESTAPLTRVKYGRTFQYFIAEPS